MQRLIISLDVKGRVVQALLDTGADCDFISKKIVNELELLVIKEARTVRFGEGKGRSEGLVKIKLQSDCKKYEHELLPKIMPAFIEEPILGIESIRDLNGKGLESKENITIFNGEKVSLQIALSLIQEEN